MEKAARFESLDSWRGICAIFVVIFHFIFLLPTSLDTSAFIRNAYLFVDFFFVLSGFVLCHSYRGKIRNAADIGRFAVKRFGRVWPLHAVVLLGFFAAIAFISQTAHPNDLALAWDRNQTYGINALLPNFLLLNAVNLLSVTAWNGPAWSIGAEFYTYLVFALLMLFAGGRMLGSAVVLSAAALAIIFWRAPDLMNSTWDFGMIRCIAGFFGGVVAYHCYERLQRKDPLEATLWEVAAVVLVVCFVAFSGDGPDAAHFFSLAAPLVFGAAVIVFAGEHGLLSLMLRSRPFRALGRYSYAIYMIHQPLLIMLCYSVWRAGYHTKIFDAQDRQPWMGSYNLLLVEFVLGVVVIAAAAHRFIEGPARGSFNRLADGVKTRGFGGRQSLQPALAARD
jgi:peptidoglycan/LPS O-acetylase OafA/YrhL